MSWQVMTSLWQVMAKLWQAKHPKAKNEMNQKMKVLEFALR